MTMRPGIGVGVIIKKEGKILLLKRKGAHGAGTWSLPGGHMEYGETPEQTAVREAKEETSLEVSNPKVIGITNDFMPDEGKHYFTIFVEADFLGGTAANAEPDSASDMGWFSKESLPSPLFIPLKNFLDNKRLF
jgi:8-oxo-dGTP diphosphatase